MNPGSCDFSSSLLHHLSFDGDVVVLPVPGNAHYSNSAHYLNNYACMWRFPQLSSPCKRYEVRIVNVNILASENQLSCDCSDHIMVEYSTNQKRCINSSNVPEKTIYSATNITIKFRTDSSTTGSGYTIIINREPSGCAQDMDEDNTMSFDIVKIPRILSCPLFTFVKVKEELYKAKMNVKVQGNETEKLAPPLQQCYCFGTCTVETDDDRNKYIGQFFQDSSSTAAIGYLNSPDPVLRKVARFALKKKSREGK
jgi:hypothetical protein